MTQRPTHTGSQAPGSPLDAHQSAEHPRLGTQRGEGGELGPQRGAQGLARVARHAAAIRDVLLLGLPDARFRGNAGIRRIHEWIDWLAEQAATVTASETAQLRAERDLLARTLAVHTQQTVDTVLADTRAALGRTTP